MPDDVQRVMRDVVDERTRQVTKWGVQHHPDGTGDPDSAAGADYAKRVCEEHREAGTLTWRDILIEEIMESFAETDPMKLREELVQSAAVCAAWIEDIDSRATSKRAAEAKVDRVLSLLDNDGPPSEAEEYLRGYNDWMAGTGSPPELSDDEIRVEVALMSPDVRAKLRNAMLWSTWFNFAHHDDLTIAVRRRWAVPIEGTDGRYQLTPFGRALAQWLKNEINGGTE
jgi:hypothetical protein